MSINSKRPFIKKTVGSQFVNFNIPELPNDFDMTKWSAETSKHDTVKNIGISENQESTAVTGSGKVYTTVNQRSLTQIAVEVLAFDKTTVSKMRAEKEVNGLNMSGRPGTRPYFAYGYIEHFDGDNIRYVWYPKCQLAANTKDIADQGDSFSEQNDTLTLNAYAFNNEGDDHFYLDSEMENWPEGLTEEMFFAKPFVDIEDLNIEGA